MIICNSTVLHVDTLEPGSDIRIDHGRVVEIGPGLKRAREEETIDASGFFALPGLIDIHTHGLKSVSVQDGSLLEYSQIQLEQGVTACVPTLFGSPEANLNRIKDVMEETGDLQDTPNILGFRPEIMYVAKTGAGSSASLSRIDHNTSVCLYEAAKGQIKIWDVSPELEGAIPFIRWAANLGVIVSLAHSGASVTQARGAIDAGLSLITHFYDTFDMAVETDAGVYPAGLTDYIQVEDRVTVEIIPDGVHVHPYLVDKTIRCKGFERVVFVTDSLKGSGNPPGIYDGLASGEKIAVTKDRGMRRVSDNALSGSCLTHSLSFKKAVRLL